MKKIKFGHRSDCTLFGETIVDNEDYEALSKYKWGLTKKGYARRAAKPRHIFLHRQILNVPDGVFVDHINGNKLDNRKSNLRIVPQSLNSRNLIQERANNNSGYKGVCKCRNKWRAYIVVNYKQKHLGCFETKEEAAKVYNKYSKLLHGNFGRPNKIPT